MRCDRRKIIRIIARLHKHREYAYSQLQQWRECKKLLGYPSSPLIHHKSHYHTWPWPVWLDYGRCEGWNTCEACWKHTLNSLEGYGQNSHLLLEQIHIWEHKKGRKLMTQTLRNPSTLNCCRVPWGYALPNDVGDGDPCFNFGLISRHCLELECPWIAFLPLGWEECKCETIVYSDYWGRVECLHVEIVDIVFKVVGWRAVWIDGIIRKVYHWQDITRRFARGHGLWQVRRCR